MLKRYQELVAASSLKAIPAKPGWSERVPRRGTERAKLMRACGTSAFLLPNEAKPGQSKFPIVASFESSDINACKVDCQGLQAAYNRARQHRYEQVAQKAKHMLETMCPESKRAREKSQKEPEASRAA